MRITQKIIITLVVFGSLYGVYLYGTRNSEVSLSESVEDADYGTPTVAGTSLSASSTAE